MPTRHVPYFTQGPEGPGTRMSSADDWDPVQADQAASFPPDRMTYESHADPEPYQPGARQHERNVAQAAGSIGLDMMNPAMVWAFSRPMEAVAPQPAGQDLPMSLRDQIDRDVNWLEELDKVPEADILSNYDVSEVLGKGGYASVYLATLRETADPWYAENYPPKLALKVMQRSPAGDQETRKRESSRMVAEINYAKRFESLGLRVYFISVSGEAVTIAMELGQGTLHMKRTFREYPLEQRMVHLAEIATKLSQIEERGFLHADLKPQNIMINTEGVPVLADFGLTKKRGSGPPRQGTPGFMPPEFWDGVYSSDVWALGLLSYMMIFEGHEPAATEAALKKDMLQGIWLTLPEDPLYATAFRKAHGEPPGNNFLERMAKIQEQEWVRQLLKLLQDMLQPQAFKRITVHNAAAQLKLLAEDMRSLGPPELETMLHDVVLEVDPQPINCTGVF